MAGKHDWNQRENYFDIHYRQLRFYERYMQSVVQYKHQVITSAFEILEAPKIIFTTWNNNLVHVNIKKDIDVRKPLGARAEAKTYSYRYHANRPDGRALVRYCSPDDPSAKFLTDNHHSFHHKHIFDELGTELSVINTQGSGQDWPFVNEFLDEVLSTY